MFVDTAGRQRRIDFAIVRGDLRLAIEVDGVEKVRGEHGLTGDRLDDAWRRQNDLGAGGWEVLRFTNGQVMSESAHCARVIGQRLTRVETSTRLQVVDPGTSTPLLRTGAAASATPAEASSSRRGWAFMAVAALAAVVVAVIVSTSGGDSNEATPSSPPTTENPEQQQLQRDLAAGAVAPVNRTYCPAGYELKANYNVGKDTHYYFIPRDGRFYRLTTPTSCWTSADEAEAGGYVRPPAATS